MPYASLSNLIKVTVLIPVLCGAPHAAWAEPELALIQTTWRDRQSTTRSATFHWTEKHVVSQWQPALDDDPPTAPGSADSTFETSGELIVDEQRMRFSGTFRIFDTTGKAFEIKRFTSAFDGDSSKDLWDKSPLQYAQGAVRMDKRISAHNYLCLKPILLVYRPFDSESIGFSFDTFVAERERDFVKDQRCVVLVGAPYAGGWRHKLWLDDAPGYFPRRYAKLNPDGDVQYQWDWTYATDKSDRVVPSLCLYVSMANDAIAESIEYRFTRAVLNDEHSPDEFHLEFPVGAFITDLKADSHGKSAYIVKADQSRRPVLPHERQQTYERLLAGGSEGLNRRPVFTTFLALNVCAALVGLGAFYFYRRLRTPRS